LSICRDGSDFSLVSLKKQAGKTSNPEEYINEILIQYLDKCRYMLVLCSSNSAKSKYVAFEIKWFIENKGVDNILLAISEGENIDDQREVLFHPIILEHGLDKKPFYDFRSFKSNSKKWQKVRDSDEELTNLASHLNDNTSGKILPLWRRELTKKVRRQRLIFGMIALFFAVVSIVAFVQWQKAGKNEKLAIANMDKATRNADTAKRNEQTAKENLKKYLVEQFQRNIRNGEGLRRGREDSLAYIQYQKADSIAGLYPEALIILSKREELNTALTVLKEKLKRK
jgi:hypothetical protein